MKITPPHGQIRLPAEASPAADARIQGNSGAQRIADLAPLDPADLGAAAGASGRVARTLSPEELERVSGVGGEGLAGHGRLRGTVELRQAGATTAQFAKQTRAPVLVTANPGTRSEVSFALDLGLKKAEALVGKEISIDGFIEKTTPYQGKISNAQPVETGGAGLQPGTLLRLEGEVKTKEFMAIGGEAPPSGQWLELSAPIEIAGQMTKELYLFAGDRIASGPAKLHGRLDVGTYGGVETPEARYAQLSGISDTGRGEPLFDGQQFVNAAGDTLAQLADPRPSWVDAPAHVFVLDPSAATVFLARMGGFIPPWVNPFHGFTGTAKLEPATAGDRAKLGFGADGAPFSVATGTPLFHVGDVETPGAVANGITTRYYLDDDTKTIYGIQEGGFAGFHNHVAEVVRLPEA